MKPFAHLAVTSMFALAAACAATSVAAQPTSFATPDDAIKYRQSTLKEMQRNFKRVADMASGRAPFDAPVAQESAQKAAELIKLPWVAFGPGTEGGDAKPVVWREPAKFKELAGKAEVAMAQVASAAKTGNLDALKATIGPAGASCKACHDVFRN